MDQVSIKYIYHHLSLQGPPKFTQIWIFGLLTNHLATLVVRRTASVSVLLVAATAVDLLFFRLEQTLEVQKKAFVVHLIEKEKTIKLQI
jgi:hypothetical protein